MSNQHLDTNPQDIKSNGEMWYYQSGGGLKIYCDRNKGEENNPIVSGIISWRAIRNALKRKDKPGNVHTGAGGKESYTE